MLKDYRQPICYHKNVYPFLCIGYSGMQYVLFVDMMPLCADVMGHFRIHERLQYIPIYRIIIILGLCI
jgi:hypothetical protein